MDIFGAHWENHWQRIRKDWEKRVPEDALVLIAGDLSWAMKYEEFLPDVEALNAMSGHKVYIKGNHDYWHCSLAKTRAFFSANSYFLQNDIYAYGGYVVSGTRGWKHPGEGDFSAQDQKIYLREIERLKLSLANATKKEGKLIGMTHYPPFSGNGQPSPFTDLFRDAGAELVVYGHIHGEAFRHGDYGDKVIDGVRYCLTSCDYLHFRLREFTLSGEGENARFTGM